jgi:hypothetical protein
MVFNRGASPTPIFSKRCPPQNAGVFFRRSLGNDHPQNAGIISLASLENKLR